jgi:hypothetical protein
MAAKGLAALGLVHFKGAREVLQPSNDAFYNFCFLL